MLRARTCLGGMVTAPHHLAAEAGAGVLREGGNAIEAMIAAAATIAVVYPHMNGIGGDGFWLISRSGEPPVGIQACGPAAGMADQAFYRRHGDASIPTRGPRAALTVAGAIGGWSEAKQLAEEAGGKIPFSRLLEPAIHHAREGVPISRSQSRLTSEKWEELHAVVGFMETYAADGIPAEGTILIQQGLSQSLQRIAEAGPGDFYRGDLARAVAAGLESAGSPLRLDDLEAYQARRVVPAQTRVKSGHLYNMPPPTQGIASLMILKIFEALDVQQADGFEHVHGLVEATKRAFLLRNAHVGDPGRMGDQWKSWLSDEWIAKEAAAINMRYAMPWPPAAKPGDTIWMGAADREGNVVSYIQSIFWEFGSGLVVPQTGILWQNRGASFTLEPGPNELAPRRLPFHTLNPAMARLDNGTTLAYGTMGGEGQPQTQSAIFTRHVLFGQDMQQAVSAPRWLLGRTWAETSTNLKLESRFCSRLMERLRDAGHDLKIVDAFEDKMGHAGMVSFGPDRVIRAATDPRADGSCAGY